MNTNKVAPLIRGITQTLLIYLVVSYTIIDARIITKRNSEDDGESRSDEGEEIVVTRNSVQERGANTPTVKKDLETEGSRSEIEAEPDVVAESEGVSRAEETVVKGGSHESDPDVPNDDPFHDILQTTTEPKGAPEVSSNTKIIVVDEQGNSTETGNGEKEGSTDSVEVASGGSRSEVEPEEDGSSEEGAPKSRSEEMDGIGGAPRADSKLLLGNLESGEGSRAEEGEAAQYSSRSDNPEDVRKSNDDAEEGHSRSAEGNDDVAKTTKAAPSPPRKRPKPNPRPWYDPEKPSTTRPPTPTETPTTKPPIITSPKPTKPTSHPIPTEAPTTTKPPMTTKPPITTKRPTTTNLPSQVPSTTPPPCALPTKPPCGDYDPFKDSDKILAVVQTAKGGFKGRRINAKAIEKIMFSKLSGEQMQLVRQGKEIKVSSNSSFVFPAGSYYFPYPIRFAGFVSP